MTQPNQDAGEELLTDDRLKAIEERANAATQGPWLVSDGSAEGFDGSWDVSGADFCGIASMATTAQVAKFPRDPEANAEFIAHAREDIPTLVREIRRLQSIVGKLPKTRDGVVIVPGMRLHDAWTIAGGRRNGFEAVMSIDTAQVHLSSNEGSFWSTREAALNGAAAPGEGIGNKTSPTR